MYNARTDTPKYRISRERSETGNQEPRRARARFAHPTRARGGASCAARGELLVGMRRSAGGARFEKQHLLVRGAVGERSRVSCGKRVKARTCQARAGAFRTAMGRWRPRASACGPSWASVQAGMPSGNVQLRSARGSAWKLTSCGWCRRARAACRRRDKAGSRA